MLSKIWMFLMSTALMGVCLGGDLSFSAPPTMDKSGDRFKIQFALSAPVDVTVSILNSNGEVVRHLAAGVVGDPMPPPEPLKQGLSQSIEWDGRDDLGKVAAGGPFKCRVRAGVSVKFGRFIGEDPMSFGSITSIVADEDGCLYIMSPWGAASQCAVTLRVFAPDGKYLRTLIPFPADLSAERAKPVATWDTDGKTFHPKNLTSGWPAFYFGANGPEPMLVSASKKNGILMSLHSELYKLDMDGGNFRGPIQMWQPSANLKCAPWLFPQMAVSSDGRYIYYSNVANLGSYPGPKKPEDIDPKWPSGRIYRQDTTKPGADPEKFTDLDLPDFSKKSYWLPDAWNKRTAAAGIATDEKGNLFVCDLVNQEVVEISPDGKKLGATKVEWPDAVFISSESGDLYVLSRPPVGYSKGDGTNIPNKLCKISGRGGTAKVVAQIPLDRATLGAMTLGKFNGKSVIWIIRNGALVRIEDQGSSLVALETELRPSTSVPYDFNRLSTDYLRDEVYVSDGMGRLYRYNGLTGEGGLLKTKDGKPFPGVDVAPGYDGTIYFRTGESYSGPMGRYTHELEPAPFSSGSHVLTQIVYSRMGIGYCEKGLGVGPNGESYLNFMYGWNQYFIAGFDGQGKAIQGKFLLDKVGYKADKAANPMWDKYPKDLTAAVIGPIPPESGGIRIDLQGNIYLGLRVRPKGTSSPVAFGKDPAYGRFTGSIVKFPPSGGTVAGISKKEDMSPLPDPQIPTEDGFTIAGALKVYPGIAPFSGGGYGTNGSNCVCRVPRFDVDRYGRIAFPNAVSNSVTLLDNAGNTMAEFGGYGNFDSQYVNPNLPSGKDKKPTVAEPEMPMAWPSSVGLSEDHIYVNDVYNRRVVRGDFVWKISAECASK